MVDYVTIMVAGAGAERFLNICKNNGIELKNIRNSNDAYVLQMPRNSYKTIRHYRKITSVHITLIKKSRITTGIPRFKKRIFFAVGIVIFLTIGIVMSKRLWRISVNGNEIYSDKVIMDCIKSQGIYYGKALKNVSCTQLQKAIRNKFDRITWVSVSLTGSKLSINIKEDLNDRLVIKSESPKDIVAMADGEIISIVTRRGTPIVTAGNIVAAGDVLVMSKVESVNESGEIFKREYVEADADILIKTTLTYEDIINRNYMAKVYTGREKTSKGILIGGFCINYNVKKTGFENCDVVTEYEKMSLYEDFYLPVTYAYFTYKEYEWQDMEYSDDEITYILNENFNNYINNLPENSTQIVSNSVKIDLNGDVGTMSGELVVITDATGKNSPVIIDERETGIGNN